MGGMQGRTPRFKAYLQIRDGKPKVAERYLIVQWLCPLQGCPWGLGLGGDNSIPDPSSPSGATEAMSIFLPVILIGCRSSITCRRSPSTDVPVRR